MRLVESITAADIHGCALCGLTGSAHPVQGFGHMDDTEKKLTTTKDFVVPTAELIAKREARRTLGGYPIAEFHPITGEPTTHFVRARCRCGADAVATVDQAPTARCSSCLMADITQSRR